MSELEPEPSPAVDESTQTAPPTTTTTVRSTHPVLVTYATKYGSTQEVAVFLANKLREAGLAVELQPVGQVRSVDRYGAVVLGAPLYVGRWPKAVRAFLAQHKVELSRRPLAVFSGGALSTEEDQVQEVREQINKQLAQFPGLVPWAVLSIGGKYDPVSLTCLHGLLAKLPAGPLHGVPASDVRDWGVIEDWAREIGSKLGE